MQFLPIVQLLHYESRLPGSPPNAVTAQTGRAADLVRWAADAYDDIQRDRDGKWKWLRGGFYVDTVAATESYAYTVCYDSVTAAFITRFRSWDLDRRQPPLIYLSSAGKSNEYELGIADWTEFRRRYVRATHDASAPSHVTTDSADNLLLGPTPDDVYRVTGDYWKSNQTLAADTDEPEMPADYHKLIVYRAMTKYGTNVVAGEVLRRAAFDGQALYDALAMRQGWARFSLGLADTLA